MSRYRRSLIPGGTYFFTVTLADRSSALLLDEIDRLRAVYADAQHKLPFETIAICVLPEHLHAIWTLPAHNADYSRRWSFIKAGFSHGVRATTTRTASQAAKRDKGVWQRRFWEHQVRGEDDLQRHVDYIHFNPVKHGLVARAADWPHSSFHRYVKQGWLPADWGLAANALEGRFGE